MDVGEANPTRLGGDLAVRMGDIGHRPRMVGVWGRYASFSGYFLPFAGFTQTLTSPTGTEQTPSPRPLISLDFFDHLATA
jgi:hypothetical protein